MCHCHFILKTFSMKQVTFSMRKLVAYRIEGNNGVTSKEARSYQKEKCNRPIFSTQTTNVLNIGLLHLFI